VQVSEVGLITVMPVAATPPIVTDVNPAAKSVPMIVTLVPPAVGPLLGVILVMVGSAAIAVEPIAKTAIIRAMKLILNIFL
jgi:hypothetical protein